jgi:hypothetical protein
MDGLPEGWKFYNDAFLFDLQHLNWVPLNCKGPLPHPRVGHRWLAIAYLFVYYYFLLFYILFLKAFYLVHFVRERSVLIGRKMWVFGGTYMDNDFAYHYFNDVWTLDLGMLLNF